MKQTILFGNGFTRTFNGGGNWNDFLKSLLRPSERFLSEGKDFSTPYAHIYEDILLNRKAKSSTRNCLTDVEYDIKSQIAVQQETTPLSDELKTIMHSMVLETSADYFLTTNYDRNLERSLDGFDETTCCISEFAYNIHRYHKLKCGNRTITIWPIHGEYLKPRSMVLGYDHYCGSVGLLRNYIENGTSNTGHYHNDDLQDFRNWRKKILNDPQRNQQTNKSYLYYRLSKSRSKQESFFWADKFMTTDLHIIATGMDFSETDLWWLLDKRYRMLNIKFDGLNPLIKNYIFCYGYFEPEVLSLLKAYGVNITYATDIKPENWAKHYKECLEAMKQNVNECSKIH
ncbi:MAG: SIR2 family protein [Bacteroidaceae bacterium]|nr:SIR2 family protein [Bacteroidaceae bacterium]